MVTDYLWHKGFGVPDRIRTKLKYVTQASWSGSITPANRSFRLNSVFDPDYAVGGSQPSWFDSYAALYEEYLVLKAHVKVVLINANTATAKAAVAISDDNDISSMSTDDLAAQKRAVLTILGGNTGMNKWTYRRTVDMADIHGQPNLDSDPDQYALVSANPVDDCLVSISVSDLAGSTNVAVFAYIEIDYDVVFKGPFNQILG